MPRSGRGRRLAAIAAAVPALGLSTPAMAVSRPAMAVSPVDASAGPRCSAPSRVWTASPAWAQAVTAADTVWPLTRGAGQRVAVLSSGVDTRNGQLAAAAVAGGTDVLRTGIAPTRDCDGRGTFLAGLVAARPAPGTTFAGVAPAATVVPIRVVQTEVLDGTRSERGGTPQELAAGIRAALAARASVICVPLQVTRDVPALRAAVAAAVAAGALVVTGGEVAEEGAQPDPNRKAPLYPQAYPGVLAVVAVSPQGGAYGSGGTAGGAAPRLRLAAPGEGLVSTASGTPSGGLGHTGPRTDPAGAVALVAGAAALVRSYRPDLSADQVATRLIATADPITLTTGDGVTGIGLVDAYQAVTSDLVAPRPGAGIALAAAPAPGAVPDPRTAAALAVAGGLLAATGLLALVVLTVRGSLRRALSAPGGPARARTAASTSGPPP